MKDAGEGTPAQDASAKDGGGSVGREEPADLFLPAGPGGRPYLATIWPLILS